MYLNIIKNCFLFSVSDYILTKFNIKGTYYFNHFIANLFVVYYTTPDLLSCYTNIYSAIRSPTNYNAIQYIFSIHFYHIFYYFNKLNFNDWLHHILMIFVALPLSLQSDNGAILSHSVFFLTGLPGGIDYFLLFLNRNRIITKKTEKRVNKYLNLWVRCPGCIASSTFIFQHLALNQTNQVSPNKLALGTIGLLIYWNGVYFMELVVRDYITRYKKIEK